jgi:thioredoxin reductase (NADPH)
VLLTAYADTDAAITAINEAHLDHYLLKPWDPPEDRLYPVIDELLDDWWAPPTQAVQGVRVFDARWSPAAHVVKDFLARNRVPYRFARRRAGPGGTRDRRGRRHRSRPPPAGDLSPTAPSLRPDTLTLARRSASRPRRGTRSTTWSSSGRGRPGWGRRCTGRPRALRTGRRARGDRGPGGDQLPDRELPRLPGRDQRERPRPAGHRPGPLKFGAEILTAVEVTGVELDDPVKTVVLSTVTGSAAVRADRRLRDDDPTARRPRSRSWRAPASTTGRHPIGGVTYRARTCSWWAAPTRPARRR